MQFNKKQIKEIVQQEIDWHTKNKEKATMPDDWVAGFIAGLKQIKKIFDKIK
ncbi:MAG: hypothetical protein ABII94_03935 [Patescibacteria group bacterium]